MTRVRSTRFPYLAAAAAAALLAGGCHRQTFEVGPDDNYLRGTNVSLKGSAHVFPSTPGSHWSMTVKDGDRISEEEIVVTGSRTVGNTSGTLSETRRGGTTYWREVYHTDSNGVSLLAAGPNADNTMTPSIELIRYPLTEGDVRTWKGNLVNGTKKTPAEACCRVSRSEKVMTPAGSFQAFRIDMVTTLYSGQNARRIPLTWWFAPDVGVVKQLSLAGNRIIVKELKSYSLK